MFVVVFASMLIETIIIMFLVLDVTKSVGIMMIPNVISSMHDLSDETRCTIL